MFENILRIIPPVLLAIVVSIKSGMAEGSSDWLTTFVTILVAILLEAMPFVLLGSLISGAIEVFVPKEQIARIVPKNRFQAVLLFGLLGFLFPVCECGIVPVIRRLLKKGVPLSCGVTYLLSAPIVQPVVLVATFVAFNGSWKIAGLRVLGGYLIAVIVGLLASVFMDKEPHKYIAFDMDAHVVDDCGCGHDHHDHEDCGCEHDHSHDLAPGTDDGAPAQTTGFSKLVFVLQHASEEFLSTGYYLIFGALMAAAMQTFIGQDLLVKIAHGPVVAALVMMVLAFTLSLCSAADAFVAAAFTQFSVASRMAFLVMGPMVDIKLLAMYSGFLTKRATGFIFGLATVLSFAYAMALTVLGAHWSALLK